MTTDSIDSILVVCTGNICRSPVGEGLLRHRLAPRRIAVSSAGTHAVVGRRPVPEAISTVLESTGEELRGRGTQLTLEAVEAADLILTMSTRQRASVTALSPRAVRRTFTLLEFARITELLGDDELHGSLADLVRACAPLRRLANASRAGMDIADPYGGPPAGYVKSFGTIAAAVDTSARAIGRSLEEPLPS